MFDVSLNDLRRRKSEKWAAYPPDVLPAWVAEMDVALAPPIRAALERALELGDTGYAFPGELAQAFSRFAHAQLDLRVLPCHGLIRCFRDKRAHAFLTDYPRL